MKRRVSLATKLILTALISYSISIPIAASVAYFETKRSIINEFIFRGKDISITIARVSRRFYQDESVADLISILQNFDDTERIMAIVAYDKKGETWLESSVVDLQTDALQSLPQAALSANTPWNAMLDLPSGERSWEFITAVQVEDEPGNKGWIRVLVDRDELEESIGHMLKLIAVLCLFAVSLGLIGLAWIVRRFLQPIPVLVAATRKIAAGEFDTQVPVESQDELGQLSLAFNRMVTDLRETHQQLIQSGKMASLGQLVAGIAHEINTPAGAIVGAIGEIDKGYLALLQQLVDLVEKLPNQQKEHYINACKLVLERDKSSSTMQQRRIARDIAKTLKEAGIDNARDTSKTMAVVGLLLEDVDELLPLLKTQHASAIQKSLFKIGMNQIHIANIGIAINRIHRLVQALKTYSHTDQAELSHTNLQEDLENTLILLHNRLKRAVTVHRQLQQLPLVLCRADQLNQVWTNLINNAVEAMKGEGNITLRLWQEQQQACVQIQDDGPGIPDDVLPRIFEPYFTTKKKGEGTGLGLGICRDIVQEHGGDIEVSSKPGCTVFTVRLPMTQTNSPSPQSTDSESDKENPETA
ncbi:MAG: ATP-binding protein [Myxococcota bacterium]